MSDADTCPRCANNNGMRAIAGIFNGDPVNPVGISVIWAPCSHGAKEEVVYENDRYTPVEKRRKFRLATLDGETLPEPEQPKTVHRPVRVVEKVYADAPVPLPKPKVRPAFLKLAASDGENLLDKEN